MTIPKLIELLAEFGGNVVLRSQGGRVVRYRDIVALAQTTAFRATRRRLVICSVDNDIGAIQGYLALLAADAVPMMISPSLASSSLDILNDTYQPDYFLLPQVDAGRWPKAKPLASLGRYALFGLAEGDSASNLPKELALLLCTSGSTGSSKYVRLSHRNVWSNAAAIADYLALTSDELPVTTLPPSYSYGLSVIHSHIWAGAGLAVTSKTLFDRDFWCLMRDMRVTSLAGVPYHYEILEKLRFTEMELPNLRTLTQAGGAISPVLARRYSTHCQDNGMRFFAMYGQTEASPRMSYVPAERAFEKAGTIGIPIPGGTLELQSETGAVLPGARVTGELVYRGPNVCLGYAECRADLSLGDINCGLLRTGDLAERDDDGYYTIVGRQNRFIKLFGNRINLLDVEMQLSDVVADFACSGHDDLLEVYVEATSAAQAIEIKREMMVRLRVGAQCIAVYEINALPRNQSGKITYASLNPENARRLA